MTKDLEDVGTTPEGVDPDELSCDHLLPQDEWDAIEAEVEDNGEPDAEDAELDLEDNVSDDEMGDE